MPGSENSTAYIYSEELSIWHKPSRFDEVYNSPSALYLLSNFYYLV